MPNWRESLAQCKGLYVLSATLRSFFVNRVAPRQLPRCHILCSTTSRFSIQAHLARPEPEVVFVGEYLRNYQALFDLQTTSKKKLLLVPKGVNLDHITDNGTVVRLARLSNAEYDSLLRGPLCFSICLMPRQTRQCSNALREERRLS